ncbi:retrovirus-related pol polyprotein from transposon 297 [Plakobranchus ocellatus]|uniref:Retrovirus-related pol polyprotein from transposon 297 n=1 Tax=Plakobranchus ocellatus TaxID=259542 RepID=A0AAV4BDN3_9GAST|nr:retrovirus-related pol polyprotein from transposon 297 [Plakobranchus ocellatus]
MFKSMGNDRYFSKIDLSKGYCQIPVRQVDVAKTAFVTMDRHYEFPRMPFGMIYSEATLTRAVKMLVRALYNVVNFVDELLVQIPTSQYLFRRLKRAD